jgi:hypothetical protein
LNDLGRGVAKPGMPLSSTHSDTQQGLLEEFNIRWLNGIKAGLTPSFQQFPPRDSVLNKKIIRMKFKKDIIITGEFMNGKKMFRYVGNMKNII